MAEGGATDIFISYNLLGDEKMARLARLMQDAEMTVAADNPLVVSELAKAAAMAGRELRVRIECDTGRKRAGVETTAEAIALARMIAATPGLTLAGLMVYPPENAADVTNAFVAEVKAALAADGITFDELSSGGTRTCSISALSRPDGTPRRHIDLQ